MESREVLEKEIKDLEDVREYFLDLLAKEGCREDIPEIVFHTIYSIILITETELGMKMNEHNLSLEDILGEKNGWEVE